MGRGFGVVAAVLAVVVLPFAARRRGGGPAPGQRGGGDVPVPAVLQWFYEYSNANRE